VPPGQQAGEQPFDHFVLSDEDFADFFFDLLDRLHDIRSCNVMIDGSVAVGG